MDDSYNFYHNTSAGFNRKDGILNWRYKKVILIQK